MEAIKQGLQFTQITAAYAENITSLKLFALDVFGDVWSYSFDAEKWRRLSMESANVS